VVSERVLGLFFNFIFINSVEGFSPVINFKLKEKMFRLVLACSNRFLAVPPA